VRRAARNSQGIPLAAVGVLKVGGIFVHKGDR
jgi:hypothetical protein